jgi:hypothetical protein
MHPKFISVPLTEEFENEELSKPSNQVARYCSFETKTVSFSSPTNSTDSRADGVTKNIRQLDPSVSRQAAKQTTCTISTNQKIDNFRILVRNAIPPSAMLSKPERSESRPASLELLHCITVAIPTLFR